MASFGILVFPEAEELDFVGPWQLLSVWSRHMQGPERCLIVAQSTNPIVCGQGLSINPQVAFADCPALDYLLIPGGAGTRREVDNPVLVDFVASQARSCRSVLSVCTGAFILHRAGLLSGRRATTHWNSLGRLRELGDVQVVEERFVRDGSVWTAAGVSAGIDLMLAFIAATAGPEVAGRVQFGVEYYPAATRYSDLTANPKAPRYVREE